MQKYQLYFPDKSQSIQAQKVNVRMENFNRTQLSNFDIAALTIIIDELNMIETLSRTMVPCGCPKSMVLKRPLTRAENKNINFNPDDGKLYKSF